MAGDVDATLRRTQAALRAASVTGGESAVVDALADQISGADLTSLLLEVTRRRAEALSPAHVMRQFARDRTVEPGLVDARSLHRVIATVIDAIPEDFEIVELSPVAPLGTHSTVATVHQHKVVSTVRASEVAADPTNALALLAAARRRADPLIGPARLGAVQRVLRTQPFGTEGQQHFTVLGLVTAGRDRGNLDFERAALVEQLGALVGAIRSVTAASITLRLTSLRDAYTDALIDTVRMALATAAPVALTVVADPDRRAGRGYYRDLCFKIHVSSDSGEFEVGDGGFTDWTAQLVGSRKERLLTSGLGLDRLSSVA